MVEVILFSIPEALAVTLLACTLLGGKLSWTRVLLIGILMGCISAVLRPLLGVYLLNAIVYTAILILLFRVFKVAALWESVISVIVAVPIYLLTEFINFTVLVDFFNIDPGDFISDLGLKVLCFLPQLFVTVLIALILSKTNVTLFWDENQGV